MSKDYILRNVSLTTILENKARIGEIYREYGVVIFPDLLTEDETYLRYLSDIKRVMAQLIRRHSDVTLPSDLGEMLVTLCKCQPVDGKIVADLGTQPNKFFSFNQLKYSDWVKSLLSEIFGSESLIVTPAAGDTLHFFPPGKAFHRYNLPAHQDYPYLMQSPRQTTFYFGMSAYKDGVGGLRIWEKSHEIGIAKSTKNEFGAFEVADGASVLKQYKIHDYHWNPGDFGIFDSLLAHSSIPNNNEFDGRVVQIFRFSDLNDAVAEACDFYSTTFKRPSISFTDIHADRYVPAE